MNEAYRRSPSPHIPTPNGLWNLWDMLEAYGRTYFATADALASVRGRLFVWQMRHSDQRYLAPDEHKLRAEVMEALRQAKDACAQIPVGKISKEIDRTIKEHTTAIIVERCAVAIRNISERFCDELEDRKFLHVPLADFYNQEALFGPDVFKKFKAARPDIASAGSCYALGQSSAAVFHLMRGMEVAVRHLARRPHMNITITPQTTWRQITGAMDSKIKAMSEATPRQKNKKELWEATRANLHHVGSVWRNSTMHPAKDYTPRQARDVLDACRVFMNALCRL